VIQELPPGTSAKKVLEEIDAFANPQPKAGKKSLTPEQQREKQLLLSMLHKQTDESDRTHPVRLVFEPKTSKVDETEFVNLLLAKTSLETNSSINLVMVGMDGRPTGKNLREILSEWVKFRFTTVTRRTQHKLAQVLDRIHVLEGRMIVLLNVDKVIKIIRNADDPKADLIKAFKLSERQAEDILEMRLRQLAKLEHIKVEQELSEKRKEQKALEKILGSRKVLEDLVVGEIEEDIKTFGDKRRTKIEEAEKAEVEGQLQSARSELAAWAALEQRAQQPIGTCPRIACGKPITGYDLLSVGQCRVCGEVLTGLLDRGNAKSTLNQRDFLILAGVLGAVLGVAYVASKGR
jgi:topoisomerase-4 subunit A